MLSRMLNIQPGVTVIIGSGGKTTLLRRLGWELRNAGYRVVLCTTTKIFPFVDIPCITESSEEQLVQALARNGLVCAGTLHPELGKLTAPEIPFAQLAQLADYVLVEGDGAARLPLKAHLPQEPVIPPECSQVICVVGMSGLNQPLWSAAHRAERFAQLSEISQQGNVTVEAVARVLNKEALADQYFLNQTDLPGKWQEARELGKLLGKPTLIGSLYAEDFDFAEGS